MSPGEKRRRKAKRERERIAYEAAMASLQAKGANCEGCKHRMRTPPGCSGKWACEIDSDFEGYTIIKLDDLCPRWQQRT